MPPEILDADGRARLAYEERLDQIERLWLQGMTKPEIVAHLQGRGAAPGCGLCHAPQGQLVATCQHGPPRWPSPREAGKPISVRMIEYALQAVQQRLRARAREDREHNRARFLGTMDELKRLALQGGALGLAYSAACRRAEVDGTHRAAEEALRPTLYDEVLELAAQLVDYEPSAEPPPAPPPTEEAARFELRRARQLLLLASDGAARYRALGDPQGKPEAERLAWRRSGLDEVLFQVLTNPAVPPSEKRAAIIAGAGTGSMITEGADLAETLAELQRRLGLARGA